MKNNLKKFSTILLLGGVILTGCQKNNEEPTKVEKDEQITIQTSEFDGTLTVNSNSKVEKIDLQTIELDEEKFQLILVAKDTNGETVWSIDYGTFSMGIGLETLVMNEGEKYVYTSVKDGLAARDKQTGAIIWKNTTEYAKNLAAANILETEDRLYMIVGVSDDYSIKVFDITNGEYIKTIEDLDQYLQKESNHDFKEYYYIIPTTLKSVDNSTISIEVIDRDENGNDTGLVGYLKISTNDYSVKFEKIK